MNKYRLFCNTENDWVNTWADEEPISCPNDGTDVHSIDINSIAIIDKNIVFEFEYDYANAAGETSTTAELPDWQEKLELLVTDLPFNGNYRIGWSFEWSFSRYQMPGANFGVHIDWGDITLTEVELVPPKFATYGDGTFWSVSGFGYTPLSAGDHKIAINFSAGGGGSIVYIRKARLEIWRVE